MIEVHAIDHVVLNVADVPVSAAWYVDVLGMRREDGADRQSRTRTSVHFGSQKINLRPVDATQDEWFTGRAPTPGSDDLCFLTDAAPGAVVAHLARCGVAVEVGPIERSGARGPIRSVYCRDPDGNLIEIASYPDD